MESNSCLTKEHILQLVTKTWNNKSLLEKEKHGKKYKHLFHNINLNWACDFEELSSKQQTLLIKGELIRTYDNLSNHYKTKLKQILGLSEFSSKWYKLSSQDKKILLNIVI